MLQLAAPHAAEHGISGAPRKRLPRHVRIAGHHYTPAPLGPVVLFVGVQLASSSIEKMPFVCLF